MALFTLLSEYVYGGSVVFPEEISSGKIVSSFGTTYNFDPNKATDKKMCVNGSFYGLNDIEGPSVFTSVAGPAFKEPQYINFLYALNGAGWVNLFGSKTYEFTLLIPNNSIFEDSEYFLHEYVTGNVLEELGTDGWKQVSKNDCAAIVNVHTALEGVTLSTSGFQVIENSIPYNYWYLKNGKITSSSTFNKQLRPEYTKDPFVSFKELTNNGAPWSNGKAYTYDSQDGLFETGMDEDASIQVELSGSTNIRYPYFAFGQLLKKAGLISGKNIIGLSGERIIVFIPTIAAIDEALKAGKIPGATNASVNYDTEELDGEYNAEELKEYILNYFIPAGRITTVPYPGSAMRDGIYANAAGNYIKYEDTGSSLNIQLQGGSNICTVIDDYDYFPFAYNDGCFHLINSILE